jgi:hypothetical protein
LHKTQDFSAEVNALIWRVKGELVTSAQDREENPAVINQPTGGKEKIKKQLKFTVEF